MDEFLLFRYFIEFCLVQIEVLSIIMDVHSVYYFHEFVSSGDRLFCWMKPMSITFLWFFCIWNLVNDHGWEFLLFKRIFFGGDE
jgi:hypothetical protein